MREILCLVLGGGRGTRLYPLTKDRAKPAVPFAGKYRLIDIPISNSLNSGFNHIYVLTQFNSESLNKHVSRTYKLDPFSKGFVEIMAAEQSVDSAGWFQGTADAVRRCLKHFNDPHIKYVLILSGDQLYKMDFGKLLSYHLEKNSQITIACSPVSAENISDYGIMCVDKKTRITKFIEKPSDKKEVEGMHILINNAKYYLASMGIYLFNKDTLVEILTTNKKADFGRGVIPDSFASKPTYAYIHQDYWKDIGTIKAFYEENLIFTESQPPIDLCDEQWQFFTRPRHLPSARIELCELDRVIVGEGSVLRGSRIRHSIIGLRSRVADSTLIEDSVIMGADFYDASIGIGKNCIIKKAIIDKNARIEEGVKIINQKNIANFDSNTYSIKDSIVIIPKNTTIPAGTVI